VKLFPFQGEHEKLLRLLRRLRGNLKKLPRHGGVDSALDGPDADVQIEIGRIDRFFRWRKQMLKMCTVGWMRDHHTQAPPSVVKALRRAVKDFS
jgi:hypothetical protein